MNSVKNIYIRNARIGQQITIDDQIVKKAGKEAPTKQIDLRGGLRVNFSDYPDYDWGRLDSVFMDATHSDLLDDDGRVNLLILGRGTPVKVRVIDTDQGAEDQVEMAL